jgi:hypothetical protein
MRELKLWMSKKLFVSLSGQRSKGVGGGLFIAPTSKRVIRELFTELVRLCTKSELMALVKLLPLIISLHTLSLILHLD